MSADGGTGKSLLALQLLVGVTCTSKWLGMAVAAKGPAIYFSAEDEKDEIHRRLEDICASEGIELSALADLYVMPLSEKDSTLVNFDSKNAMAETELWRELEEYVEEIEPKLVVIDTRADVFGGDEIKRHQVRSFVSLLRGLATKYDTAIVLLSHPSLTGMATQTGQSGSTGWGNSVRSRLYFESDKEDNDLRTLSNKKANYGKKGFEMRCRWSQGVFVAAAGDVAADTAAAAMAGEKFLELLVLHAAQNIPVSAKPGGSNYAPKMFARHGQSAGISESAFKAAMERLLKSGAAENVQYGPPSKGQCKLVTAEAAAAMEAAEVAKGKPRAAVAIALDALTALLAGNASVTVDEWRKAAIEGGISEGGKRACEIAFKKAREALVEGGHVVVDADGRVSLGVIK